MTTTETAPAQAEHAPEIPSKNLPPIIYGIEQFKQVF